MSYYITAHRSGNKFNIPVEEKHKYITDGIRLANNNIDIIGYSQALPDSITTTPTNTFNLAKPNYSQYIQNGKSIKPINSGSDSVIGLNLISNYIKLFYRPSMLTIEQGTGARQRIGDKIFLKNVQIMINLTAMYQFYKTLAGNSTSIEGSINNTYPTGYTGTSTGGTIITDNQPSDFYVYKNNRMNTKAFMKFKIMIVRFDDLSDLEEKKEEDLQIFIRNWFNRIYVPLAIIPASDDTYYDIPVVSNQSKMLRESTQYNGSYTILYNEMIELNEKDYSRYIKINLEPKMNLTFKDSDNHPTTENFNNVFGFIIPPTYYKTDMDIVSYDELLRGNTNVAVAEFTTNIKFTYYDI